MAEGAQGQQDRLIEVFSNGLGVDPSTLSDESNPDNTPEWDSLAAMNLVIFTLMATASLTGVMEISKKKLINYVVLTLVLTIALIAVTRGYFSIAVKNEYERDHVIANMQSSVQLLLDRKVRIEGFELDHSACSLIARSNWCHVVNQRAGVVF